MILDRYIGRTLIANSALALFILVAIFAFFTIFDQLGESGKGKYGVLQVLQYVLLITPRLMIEILPIACVIGSMTTLGTLANSSELAVMRTSGISKVNLAVALLKTGLLIVVFSLLLGELVAPKAERAAQNLKSIALTNEISTKTKHGLWSRDGNSFINIKTVLPNGEVEDITIFEFNANKELQAAIKANKAKYDGDKWLMENVNKTNINEYQISKEKFERVEWRALLSPEVINMVTVRPQLLSIYGLVNYIKYLRINEQNTKIYEQAFWLKLINPFSIMAMLLLSLCLVNSEGRSVSIGQRVFIGALLGILFHLVNQVSGHIGVVYGLPAVLCVSLPTIMVLIFIGYTIRNQP